MNLSFYYLGSGKLIVLSLLDILFFLKNGKKESTLV